MEIMNRNESLICGVCETLCAGKYRQVGVCRPIPECSLRLCISHCYDILLLEIQIFVESLSSSIKWFLGYLTTLP
jgi:hypothetical protein